MINFFFWSFVQAVFEVECFMKVYHAKKSLSRFKIVLKTVNENIKRKLFRIKCQPSKKGSFDCVSCSGINI